MYLCKFIVEKKTKKCFGIILSQSIFNKRISAFGGPLYQARLFICGAGYEWVVDMAAGAEAEEGVMRQPDQKRRRSAFECSHCLTISTRGCHSDASSPL